MTENKKPPTFSEKAAELLIKAADNKKRPRLKPVYEAEKQLKLDPLKMSEIAKKFEENRKAVYRLMLITLKNRKMNKK